MVMAAWTNEETFKFIELYQNEPCIWNPKHKHHKDKLQVNNAWIRMSDAMGVPTSELKKKKETLLSAFRLNHKKVLASRIHGGEDQVFQPIWIYYDALASFMADVYECKSLLTSEVYLYDNSLVEEAPPPSQSSASDEFSAEEERENSQSSSRISVPVKKRQSHKSSELQETKIRVKNELSELKNDLSENRTQSCESEDDCDLYGRLLATKLRQFTDHDRYVLMYEIDGMLLKRRQSKIYASSPKRRRTSSIDGSE